jgi:hypothetical protein
VCVCVRARDIMRVQQMRARVGQAAKGHVKDEEVSP